MKRKTTSLGYIGTCPSFAVMYDGQKYTIERLYGGSIRKKINGNCYRSDEEARAVLSDDVEWRTLNVRDRFIRSARNEFGPDQLYLCLEVST
jgi:hypothetical protein